MTKQVALSDRAYTRLRRTRLEGESFSQAVERLIETQSKDPLRFLEHLKALPQVGSQQERLRRLGAERDATRGPA